MISPVELLYLMDGGTLRAIKDGALLTPAEYFTFAKESDPELAEKDKVYTECAGDFIPRTRTSSATTTGSTAGRNGRSDMLVHAVEKEAIMPMSVISRSVRMAHSVKKKMLFGCVHTTGIQFVEFARIKL